MANDGPSRDAQMDRMETLLSDCKGLLQDIKDNTSAG